MTKAEFGLLMDRITDVDVKLRKLIERVDKVRFLQGPAGPTGPMGPAGPAGPMGNKVPKAQRTPIFDAVMKEVKNDES